MKKINNNVSKITLTESSYSQSIRIVEAIGNMQFSVSDYVIVRIGCYVKPYLLKKYAQELNFNEFYVSSSIKGWGRFLPIPKQNHILLFNPVSGLNIYKFFNLVKESYPIFELLLIKSSKNLDLDFLKKIKHNLFYEINNLKKSGLALFFCGFDFDDSYFSSGFSKAYYGDFVPNELMCYFR